MNQIRVPREVLAGLEAARQSGRTNMLDVRRVAELADEMGHPQAAAWIRRNRQTYARGFFQGIVANDGTEGE